MEKTNTTGRGYYQIESRYPGEKTLQVHEVFATSKSDAMSLIPLGLIDKKMRNFFPVDGTIVNHAHAVFAYRRALKSYFEWHGRTPTAHFSQPKMLECLSNDKKKCLGAPEAIEKQIINAGLSFKKVWHEVHGVDPETIPSLKSR